MPKLDTIHATCGEVNTDTDRTLRCNRSKDHGRLLGKRTREHYDSNHDLYWSGEFGVYTAEQARDRRAAGMAEAVWQDLTESGGERLKRAEDGYRFRYAGRTYRLACVEGGGWFLDIVEHDGEAPFHSGAEWTGRRREDAVKAMVAAAYGHPCPHGYGTGRDSCPGCDSYGYYESDS